MKDDAELREDVKALKCQFETLVLNKLMNAADTYQVDVCGLCTSLMHHSKLPYFVNKALDRGSQCLQ